jgi:hypothetical protein
MAMGCGRAGRGSSMDPRHSEIAGEQRSAEWQSSGSTLAELLFAMPNVVGDADSQRSDLQS